MSKEKQKKFFSEKEIETMEKDLKMLREKRAEEERKKLLEITEKKIEKIEKNKEIPKQQEGTSDILPPPPSKPLKVSEEKQKSKKKKNWQSLIEKISIRLVFILIFLGIISILLYLHQHQKPTPPPSQTPPAQTPPSQSTTQPLKEELNLPQDLFPVNYTKIILIEDISSLHSIFLNSLNDSFNKFGFYRVFFKKNETELYSPNEILTELILLPEEVITTTNLNENSNFMLFVYNNGSFKRVGIIIKIPSKNKGNLLKTMKSWEKTMEKDISPFLSLLSESKDKYYKPYFREKSYLNYPIRYQTFSKNDYGICYTISNDYLIITTSLESIIKVVSLLENNLF
jgi:hypothetical protein